MSDTSSIAPDDTPRLALIGDLIASRRLEDRAAVQEDLIRLLADCNSRYAGWLISPFRITLGDEFQGLASSGFPFSDFLFRINHALRPRVGVRLGLGLGRVTTSPSDVVSDLDGPCFHSARDAVQDARDRQALLAVKSASGERDSRWLQSSLVLIEGHLRQFSLVRWQTAALLLELKHPTEVARARGVTRQSVEDVLKGAQVHAVVAAIDAFSESIDRLLAGQFA